MSTYGSRNKPKYTEIARTPITSNRKMIISSCSTGGYTIAQQATLVEDDGREVNMFYKGALHIQDLRALYDVRDCINIAIKKVEEQIEEDKVWDDVTEE